MPPIVNATGPRDIVFVLDRSGSMSGWKMSASRRGISRLIDTLAPHDRFQVLAFDDQIESPWSLKRRHQSQWVNATDSNRFEAVRWLANINSRGGTEMGVAMDMAVNLFAKSTSDDALRSRSIVLVTDGQISGEASVLRVLGKLPEPERPRIYCLGVDRAVNASVLQRLTKLTDGTFELVESQQRLDEVMTRLSEEMGSPAITDLQILSCNENDFAMTLAPSNRRTLYSARAVSIYGRADTSKPLSILLRGRLANGAEWTHQLTASAVSTDALPQHNSPLLLPLWGRQRVRQLEDAMAASGKPSKELKSQIVDCSLECGVLSRFTAFVAVDESEIVNTSGRSHRMVQPVELPDGWSPTALGAIPASKLIPRSLANRSSGQSSSADTGEEQFVRRMLSKGIVSLEQVAEAEEMAKNISWSVADALVHLQYATAEEVSRVLATTHALPYVDLQHTPIERSVIELVPESVARENNIIPIREIGALLQIAVSDPRDLDLLEKIRFILNRTIQAVIAPKAAIAGAINAYYGTIKGDSADSMLQEFTDTAIDFTETDGGGFDDEDATSFGFAPPPPASPAKARERSAGHVETDTAPVVRLVSLLIAEAIQLRASRIELRSDDACIAASYLIEGAIVERDKIPRRMLAAIVSRLKILCHLDITNVSYPQRGEFDITVGNQAYRLTVVIEKENTEMTITIEIPSSKSSAP